MKKTSRMRLVPAITLVAAAFISTSIPAQADESDKLPGTPQAVTTGGLPTGFSSWSEVLDNQRKVDLVAQQVTQVNEQLTNKGLGSVVVSPETLSLKLYWHGQVPAEVINVIAAARASGIGVEMLSANYTKQQLLAAAEEIASKAKFSENDTGQVRITMVGPMPDASGVRVSVMGDTDDALALPAITAAQTTTVIETGVDPAEEPLYSAVPPTSSLTGSWDRWHDVGPFWGGANIGGCTSAFTVTDKETKSKPRMVTAAHCNGFSAGSATANMYTTPGGVDYGWAVEQWGGAGYDAAILHVPGGTGTPVANTYSTAIYNGDPLNKSAQWGTSILGSHQNFIGDYVCSSGSYSGTVCNAKVKGLDETYGGTSIKFLVRVEHVAGEGIWGPGDSGGPVEELSADGSKAYARGVISMGDDAAVVNCHGITTGRKCHWRGWMTDINHVESLYGPVLTY